MARITETTFAESVQVDRDLGVIHGVKILGRESRNNRTYTESAMDQAAKFYEGIDVNIDHPDKRSPHDNRRMDEGIGVLRNIKRRGDGVYGDLHYLKSHPVTEMVLERAERMPNRFGLSHNADGRTVIRKGREVVESIDSVESVDLVRNPATVNNLFESEDTKVKTTVKKIVEKFLGRRATKRLVEMEVEVAGEPVAEVPVEVAPEESSEDQIKAAFRSMVMAAFDDETLDTKGTLAKIREILSAQEKLLVKEEDALAEPPIGDAKPSEAAMESYHRKIDPTPDSFILKGLQESVLRMEQQAAVRDVLDERGLSPSDLKPERLRLLREQKDADGMRSLLESWPAYELQSRRSGPRSSRPLMESGNENTSYPKDAESFASSIV